MFLPIDRLEDIQIISGILVKNGMRVERAKVKKNKSYQQGITVTVMTDIKELNIEDDE